MPRTPKRHVMGVLRLIPIVVVVVAFIKGVELVAWGLLSVLLAHNLWENYREPKPPSRGPQATPESGRHEKARPS